MNTELENDLQNRCNKLASRLQDDEAAIISIPVNIFYFLGRIINGCVYINGKGDRFVFLRRPEGLHEDGYLYIRKVEQIPDLLQQHGIALPSSIMLECDELPYSDCIRLQKAFDCQNMGNVSKIIKTLRSVKSEYEISQLRIGGRLQSEALEELPGLYRSGMSDNELCIECERLFRQKGCLGLFRTFGADLEGFMGSLLAGDNAGEPSPYDFALGGAGMHPSLPLGHNGTILEKGMSVMVDMNGNFNGYISDQSRTFAIGKLSDAAYYAHNVSIEIHNEIAAKAKAGAICEDLWQTALDIVAKHGLQDCFMGKRQKAKFVGHGIGLQINEPPVLCAKNKTMLENGNVIALEPKFIIDGTGAVGIENSYVITERGCEKITTAPEEIIMLGEV